MCVCVCVYSLLNNKENRQWMVNLRWNNLTKILIICQTESSLYVHSF